MKRLTPWLAAVGWTLISCHTTAPLENSGVLDRIVVAPDGRGFVHATSRKPFHPWGLNHGNGGRLMEDFWDQDWATFAADFREMKSMGANVVRVHLQFGKFMAGPEQPDVRAFRQLERLLHLAEDVGIYLDVTGLACYRPRDVPAWFDALNQSDRWKAQESFWAAVAKTCASSRAVFCYDLINEPISAGPRREAGKWYSGALLGGYDFIQYIALEPSAGTREETARIWIQHMTAAIRRQDRRTLITVGLLPWSRQWKHLSGFVPEKISGALDFVSVHIYPDRKLPEEAMEALRQCAVGKPVVIEETFPLSCDVPQLEEFLRASRSMACGWVGHFDGLTPQQMDVMEKKGQLTPGQKLYREWLRLFIRLRPEFAP
jgi:hypothetical protein